MASAETDSSVEELVTTIKLVAFDFDGVFTDNSVYVFEDGSEAVRCSRSDGIGLRKLDRLGVETIIISTEENPVVARRAEKLKIRCIHGVGDKRAVLQTIADEHGFDLSEIAFVGNDINDLGALTAVGLPIAVQDSYPEVIQVAKYTTNTLGGYGAVREICDMFERIRGSDTD
jgi:YrbI family 3-deoxy-D-manno-octulosonate 8-phosphate phosphatase